MIYFSQNVPYVIRLCMYVRPSEYTSIFYVCDIGGSSVANKMSTEGRSG